MALKNIIVLWLLVYSSVLATAFKVVSCDDDKQTCTVRLDLTDRVHYTKLVRDKSVFFATVSTGIYGEPTLITGTVTPGNRYHTRIGEKYWGTAWISEDGEQLIEGIFQTERAGVVEWPPRSDNQRNLQTRAQDLVLELPEGRPWFPIQQQRQTGLNTSQYGQGEFIPFFPTCYPQDSVMHVVKLNIIYDAGLYAHLTAGLTGTEAEKQRHVLAGLETVLAPGKLIFLAQLNIRIEVKRVIFSTVNDPLPFSRGASGSSGCVGAPTAMSEFMQWLGKNNPLDPTGYWLLLSNCFGSVNGVSYIGSLCSRTSNGGVAAYAWSVIFHELGHALGSTHSFEHGVGLTGGLMDYGNTRYNGISQIHPFKRSEMCSFLSYLKQATTSCPFFVPASTNSLCGDGVLTREEACECLERSVTSCGKCVQCQLTDPSVQCASKEFVVRHAESPSIVLVDQTALSSPECCLQHRLVPPKTLCRGGLDGCGGAGGKCVPTCALHLLTNTPNCGFDESGCMLGCVWKSRCRFDITYPAEDGSQRPISALPDGTSCWFQSGQIGRCHHARCSPLTNASTGTPTSATNQPSKSPTLRPTRWPSIGTWRRCRKRCKTMQCRRRRCRK